MTDVAALFNDLNTALYHVNNTEKIKISPINSEDKKLQPTHRLLKISPVIDNQVKESTISILFEDTTNQNIQVTLYDAAEGFQFEPEGSETHRKVTCDIKPETSLKDAARMLALLVHKIATTAGIEPSAIFQLLKENKEKRLEMAGIERMASSYLTGLTDSTLG